MTMTCLDGLCRLIGARRWALLCRSVLYVCVCMWLFKSDLDVVVHEVGLLSLVCEWVWLWWVSMT